MKTKNEEKAILSILKSPESEYNSNNLSKQLKITPMGTLKLLKKLEKEGILKSKKISNIHFYGINFINSYAVDYVSLILKSEAEHCFPYIKRWINEIKKIKEAEIAIVFGSVIKNFEKVNDIDVLLVLRKENFDKLRKEIEKLNIFSDKKIHPVYQTREDLIMNIEKKDRIILDAIKGVAVFGEKEFVEILGRIK